MYAVQNSEYFYHINYVVQPVTQSVTCIGKRKPAVGIIVFIMKTTFCRQCKTDVLKTNSAVLHTSFSPYISK